MSLPEIADRLTASLQTSTDLLGRLHDGMLQRRTAWIAVRPGSVQRPAVELHDLALALSAEDDRRADLLERAAALLPPVAGGSVGGRKPRLDVTTLAPHLPAAHAARLQRAAAAATAGAGRVRTELALGQRLLRYSQQAHENMLAGLGAAMAEATADVGGYDRSARRVAQALPGNGACSGRLIDGRM